MLCGTSYNQDSAVYDYILLWPKTGAREGGSELHLITVETIITERSTNSSQLSRSKFDQHFSIVASSHPRTQGLRLGKISKELQGNGDIDFSRMVISLEIAKFVGGKKWDYLRKQVWGNCKAIFAQ